MTTRKPATRKPSARKPSTHQSSKPITILADEAVLLWDVLTDPVTAAQVRALLPDRIQLVARPRPARPIPKPAAVAPSPIVGRAAA
jgi:hypothetical protein